MKTRAGLFRVVATNGYTGKIGGGLVNESLALFDGLCLGYGRESTQILP